MKKIYSLFCILFLTTAGYATIHYHVVNEYIPNTTSNTKDLDMDGDDDFSINPYNGHTTLNCLKPTSYYAADGSGFPKSYTTGQSLGTGQWISNTGTLKNTTNSTGNFGNTPSYLLVKFSDGTNTYFGWMQVSAGSSGGFIVDYAYEDVPNKPIATGQTTSVGIEEISPTAFSLTALNRNTIAFENCSAYDHVKFYTVDGRLTDEIANPTALEHYALSGETNVVVVAFLRKEQLVYSKKYLLP